MNTPTNDAPAGRPPGWEGALVEVGRLEGADPSHIGPFLEAYGLGGPFPGQQGDVGVALLVGAPACARLAGVPTCRPGPVTMPEVVAVAYRRCHGSAAAVGRAQTGRWRTSWSDAQHAAAVATVREAIGRGELYQANVVGHRSASASGDPRRLAALAAAIPGAVYGGTLSGEGWAIGSASPEQLVKVLGTRISTTPVKGTSTDKRALLASGKDRAEHVMIVDLARNDLSRLARTGSVQVEQLYAVSGWSGLWHAASRVCADLEPGVGATDVLGALAPGGSVTGAPKHAACGLLSELETVGRGPSMGAFGFVWPGGMDLGLTIRTVGVADGRAHLWAGGGITWGSDPLTEVAEAHAKAAPVMAALSAARLA